MESYRLLPIPIDFFSNKDLTENLAFECRITSTDIVFVSLIWHFCFHTDVRNTSTRNFKLLYVRQTWNCIMLAGTKPAYSFELS